MKNNIFKDILINIGATMLPIIILQIISLPIIAKTEGVQSYGEIVFLVSVFTIISFPLGNVLNNIRLLKDKEYRNKKIEGDFNLILTLFISLSVLFFVLFSHYSLKNINVTEVILLISIIILYAFREYFVVSFRLELNFKNILYNNIFLGTGFFIGTIIYIYIGYWQLIYLLGYLLSVLFIIRKSKLPTESFKKTVLFKDTFKETIILYFANILKNLINHADKILLFPLLGPVNVAVYYTSAIIGKMITMIINPVNAVVLSYLVREEKKKNILNQSIITFTIGLLFYVLIINIGPSFLKMFYNEWADKSISILKYTTATAIVTIFSTLLHPYNLRYNHIKYQLIINFMYLIMYVSLTVYLTHKYSLVGFSIAVLLSSLLNLLMQVVIFITNQSNTEKGTK